MEALPINAMEHLCTYFTIKDTLCLASVDKKWRKLISDGEVSERIWRFIYDMEFGGSKDNNKVTYRLACKINTTNCRRYKKQGVQQVVNWAVGCGHGALLSRLWHEEKWDKKDIQNPKKIILAAVKECNILMIEWCAEVEIDADWQYVFSNIVRKATLPKFMKLLQVTKFNISNRSNLVTILVSAIHGCNVSVLEYLLTYILNKDDIECDQILRAAIGANDTIVWDAIKTRYVHLGDDVWHTLVNCQLENHGQTTPLIIAAFKRCAVTTEWLLENGADIHARNSHGQKAIHASCMEPKDGVDTKRIIDSLLAHGADINELEDVDSLLRNMLVCNKKEEPEAEMEVGTGGERRGNEESEVQEKADTDNNNNNIDQIKQHDNETDIEEKEVEEEKEGEEEDLKRARLTPLHYAVRSGSVDLVKYLLNKGADITVGEHGEQGRFHWSETESCLYDVEPILLYANTSSMAMFLLDLGVNAKAVSSDGENVFHHFILADNFDKDSEDGIIQLFERLIFLGVDPNEKNRWQCVPTMHYLYYGLPLFILKWFVECAKMDIETRDDEGNTPLLVACRPTTYSRPGGPQYLISKGADVNASNKYGQTPIYVAPKCLEVAHPKHTVVEALLKAGAQPNVITTSHIRETPLHQACAMGTVESVKLLVEHGADMLALNHDGATPAQLVSKEDIRAYLTEKMREMNSTIPDANE